MVDDRTESEQEYPDSYTEGVRIELPDLSRVALEPDDVLLVRSRRLTHAQVQLVKLRLSQVFPGHEIL